MMLTELRENLKQLDIDRSVIQERIVSLQNQEKVQLNGRQPGCVLVDNEDFPLSDIDVHAVRIIRYDLAKAQQDYNDISSKIERSMMEYHKQALLESKNSQKSETPSETSPVVETETISKYHIFPEEREYKSLSWIKVVLPKSPADLAGICVDDEIISFNGRPSDDVPVLVHFSNTVRNNIENPIRIVLRRKPSVERQLEDIQSTSASENLRLTKESKVICTYLTPKKWEGPGYLGCEVVPFTV